MPWHKTIDLSGQHFGKWMVVREAKQRGYNRVWVCSCSGCGNEHLRGGKSLGCWGCREKAAQARHGHARRCGRAQTYKTWCWMVARCTNPGDVSWSRYGGAGIRVCERWRGDYAAFLEDMGEQPPGLTIDRINSAGNYEPGNCRWATRLEQGRNRRSVRLNTEAAKVIRHLAARGVCQALLARLHGVSTSSANRAALGHTWGAT